MDEKQKRIALIGGAVAGGIALVVLIALYVMGGGQDGSTGLFSRLSAGLSRVGESFSSSPSAEAPEFAFRRVEIDTSSAQAKACLVFTRDLDKSGRTHYEDYLKVDPQTRIALTVAEDRLCIGGLEFNATYNVTLKVGLPAASGEKLAEEETIPVELRDKPALLRFAGGIILPRENIEGVPITTVNIDNVKLKVVRVGDRLLSQIESGVVDQTTLYSWDETQLENAQGSLVWEGTIAVANVKNDSVVTLIPLRKMLRDKKPGAYVLIASDAAKKKSDEEYSSEEMAAQWVIDSDISLTTFQGASGLTVFARSYNNAKQLSGVKLNLVARNNNVLGTVTTDSNGRADFAAGLMRGTGGDEPVVVMAYAGDDFSFLDLRRPAFDLTDRGVGGRDTPGPVDAYLYTERGVYRPGETVRSVAMLRDRVGKATDAPLTLVAQRPDGLEVARITVAGASLAAGSAAWSVPLNKTAPHGRWQISAYIDPKAPPVGRVQFDVADFIPQRLKVSLNPAAKVLQASSDFTIKTESRFLYGAPASGLSGEGNARITADPQPFKNFKEFQFGRVDDTFADVNITLNVPETDAAGVTEATGTIGELPDTTLPLKAMIKVSIHEPGGRTTDKAVDLPVRTRNVFIGLRPDFDGGSVGENAKAGFEVIALDGNGKRIQLSGLTYSWVKENTTYQWYQQDGQWKYQSTMRDRLISSGQMGISAGQITRMANAMPWGSYRLTIRDPKSGAESSYRFYSGWAASAAGDRPDRIPVASDKQNYRAGDTARVSIKPTASGKALVVVAGDKVFSSQLVDVSANGTTISVKVSEDWGPGAYVLVTAYRPLNQATGREPVRAIGLVWLGVDNSERTLGVLLGGAKKITPRQRIMLPVTVKGLDSGEDAYLTVAAVDEGILQLTDFASPNPVDYYFGKRRLGIGMRDDYGRLIKPEKAAVGSFREGGDSFGGRPLAVVPTKTVALFSGLVKVGSGGMVQVPLDIPDFNGELRLMAVAWSREKVGHADRPMTVRDPVVADIVLPRFLAPGDKAEAALNMNNVEGRPGQYVATVTGSGPVGFGNGRSWSQTISLNRGQRVLVPVTITGNGMGIANVSLKVTGPGFAVTHGWQIEVRAPQLDIARDETLPLAPQASYRADRTLISDIAPSTANVALTVAASHGYDNVPGLLKWLDKYPYGCVEQLSSRAMPLLVFNDLADLAGLPRDQALKGRIQETIDSVLDMQNYAGNFGMWSSGSDSDPWISSYALDFLMQAKKKGYIVPNESLKRGANWLRQTASSDSYNDSVRAYAFYLLARSGQVNLSDLRYFSDTRGPEMKVAIAAALTGAAAARAGDWARAATGFNRAREIAFKAQEIGYSRDNYGSLLRDLAGTIALAAENNQVQLIPALVKKSQEVDMRLNATTTQEKAWMLRAAYELTRAKAPLNILVNNRQATPRANAIRLSPNPNQLSGGITLTNKGDAGVWRTTSVQGTPIIPLAAESNVVSLTKTVWTVGGSPADLSGLRRNDRVVVLLNGSLSNNYYRQMGIIDLLPAGLEIESTLDSESAKTYPFVGQVTYTSMSDARDDRFVAAFNVGSQYQSTDEKQVVVAPQFRIAYVARAVTAGSFVMPGGNVEDMYAPTVRARTSLGTVTIAP